MSRYINTASTVATWAPPKATNAMVMLPFHRSQPARGDREGGGQLAGAVGQEQSLPGDGRADGEEHHGEAGAVERPIGRAPEHDPQHLAPTQVHRGDPVMIPWMCSTVSPRGLAGLTGRCGSPR